MRKAFYSNCLVWALWMEAHYGGCIKSRPSHRGPFRHWMWSPDGERHLSFTPVDQRWKPWIWFLGYVMREK